MAFAAQAWSLPLVCWLLFGANLAWTIAYDTEYAMVDRDDDLRVGIKSTAILFGKYDVAIIGLLQLATLGLLAIVGWLINGALVYWLALLVAAGLFIWQLWMIRNRQTDTSFRAFRQNHYVGMVITIGIALHYWLPAPLGMA